MFKTFSHDRDKTTWKKSVRQIFFGGLFTKYIAGILLVILGFLIATFSLEWLEQLGMGLDRIYLYLPAIVSVCLTQIIIRISPSPRFWSRGLIVTILIGLTLRYLFWRSLSSLNLSNPIDGIFSISLFVLELLVIFSSVLQLYLMYHLKDRRREADYYSQQVINKPLAKIFYAMIKGYFFANLTCSDVQNI